jgi:nucleolar protein 56
MKPWRGTGVLTLSEYKEYKLWFGRVGKNSQVTPSKDFKKSFQNCENPEPIPFSPSEVGIGYFGSADVYYSTLRKVAIEVAREKVEQELKREDRYAVLLLKSLDELNEAINLLEEKLRDLEEVKVSEVTKSFRDRIAELKRLRREVEKEIEAIVSKIAPNMTEIAGAVIAARLLEKAGSLKRLAEMPSSAIQLLGAEKSLYKALSRVKKGKPARFPKHGVIFQHPFVRTLPKSKRGKMARFMAAKLAIAARLDYFSGELNEELGEAVRKRYEQLRR